MRSDVDPPSLAPEDRFREVAALLAAGLLRLHTRAVAADPRPGGPPRKIIQFLSELP